MEEYIMQTRRMVSARRQLARSRVKPRCNWTRLKVLLQPPASAQIGLSQGCLAQRCRCLSSHRHRRLRRRCCMCSRGQRHSRITRAHGRSMEPCMSSWRQCQCRNFHRRCNRAPIAPLRLQGCSMQLRGRQLPAEPKPQPGPLLSRCPRFVCPTIRDVDGTTGQYVYT